MALRMFRDEMEEWSASEANLFEEALDKYGKDFNDIRQVICLTLIGPESAVKKLMEFECLANRYVL